MEAETRNKFAAGGTMVVSWCLPMIQGVPVFVPILGTIAGLGMMVFPYITKPGGRRWLIAALVAVAGDGIVPHRRRHVSGTLALPKVGHVSEADEDGGHEEGDNHPEDPAEVFEVLTEDLEHQTNSLSRSRNV